jgi:predicted  nucleic acid-binding Zn-ribbon protein
MEIEYEHRLTAVEDRSKSNADRLDAVEKRQDNLDDLVSAVKVLDVREKNVEKDVSEIKADVKTLTNKPAKRWDDLVDKAIMLLAGGIIGWILTQIGL